MPGPGKYTLVWSHSDGGAIRLWNFEVDQHGLKEEHRTGLEQWVMPQLKAGGSARVIGLASRTGSAAHNTDLSERRAHEVVEELLHQGADPARILSAVAKGEEVAEAAGDRDNKENSAWRAVTVFYWRRPDPPAQAVLRHATKIVILSTGSVGSLAGVDGRVAASENLNRSFYAGNGRGVGVLDHGPILVPIGFVVTHIETSKESWGIHNHVPAVLQEPVKAILKAAQTGTGNAQVYRFRWGPATSSVVPVWELDAKGKPVRLKEHVTRSRAMWIYEHPDAYQFAPEKGPK
jgi:hypothetical protein